MAEVPLDVETVRGEVDGLVDGQGVRQATIAREAGIGASVLSQFLQGRYAGDNMAVATKLAAWIEARARRDGLPAALSNSHGFVVTAAARRALDGLEYAHDTGDLVVIFGAPGVGKTATLEHYRASASNAWLVTMTAATATKAAALEEVSLALGLPLIKGGGPAGLSRQIVRKLRGTRGLLMIDEADKLQTAAIEAIRGVIDAAKVGCALCGSPDLAVALDRLPQLDSRVGRKVGLDKPSRKDVTAVAAELGVAGTEEVDFLATVAGWPGGMRCVVKVIRLALLEASGAGAVANAGHLAAAWKELALFREGGK